MGRTITPCASNASARLAASPPTVDEQEVAERRADGLEAVCTQGTLEHCHGRTVHVAPPGELGLVVEADERSLLSRRAHVERPAHLAHGRDHALGADAVSDAEPGEPVDLAERAQDEHAVALLRELLDRVRVVGIVDVLEVGLVDDGEHVLGSLLDEGDELGAHGRRPGRVVRRRDVDDLRPRRDRGQHGIEIEAVLAQRHSHRHRAELERVEDVARKRRPPGDDLVAGVEQCVGHVADHRVGAGADRRPPRTVRRVAPRERRAAGRRRRRDTGSARRVERSHRLEGLREGPERAFVGRELDHVVEPELALNLLDRLPRLVGHEPVERRPQGARVDVADG